MRHCNAVTSQYFCTGGCSAGSMKGLLEKKQKQKQKTKTKNKKPKITNLTIPTVEYHYNFDRHKK